VYWVLATTRGPATEGGPRHGVGQRRGHPVGAEVSICFHPGLALLNAPAEYKFWLAPLSELLI
jgi:hypothetical protein